MKRRVAGRPRFATPLPRRLFEQGLASVELVACLPVFLALVFVIVSWYRQYYAQIGLTTVANDCAQVGSMNWNQNWRNTQAQAAVTHGTAGYGLTSAAYDGPTRLTAGTESVTDVRVNCVLAILAPGGGLTPGGDIDRDNPSNVIRDVFWPLQVHRSCYNPSITAVSFGSATAGTGEDATLTFCGNN